ncbi:MAG: SPOR domain-containing protein [Pseudomonadota bacterium]
MDQTLKQRLVGVALLTALAVIFVPMLFDDPVEETGDATALDIPEFPAEFESSVVPLPLRPDHGVPLSEPVPETELAVERPPLAARPSETLSKEDKPAGEGATPEQEPAAGSAAVANPDPMAAPGPSSTIALRKPHGAPDRWFVQVGSFGREENATILRDKLRKKGYAAFLEIAESEVQGKVYRVKVGPEEDKPNAKKVRDKIKVDFGAKGIVIGAE